MNAAVEAIKSGLVVSCQAAEGNPLRGAPFMAAMAQAAAAAGAVGIRAEGAEDVAAIKAATGLPVIGIRKIAIPPDGRIFITPNYYDAELVVAAGASIVATDGTSRPRPDGHSLTSLIQRVHDQLGVPVMADVDSVESGRHAYEAGADLLATTLSGYTGTGPVPDGPDIDLVAALVDATPLPVVAEGRMWTPSDLRAAFAAGAYAAVIGTAITNPFEITRRFIGALNAVKEP